MRSLTRSNSRSFRWYSLIDWTVASSNMRTSSAVPVLGFFRPLGGVWFLSLATVVRVLVIYAISSLRRLRRKGRLLMVKIAFCFNSVSPIAVVGYWWCEAPTCSAIGECFVSSITVPVCLGFGVLCALGVNGTAAYSDLCVGCWKEENGTIEGFHCYNSGLG